jgi:hypothetical protein
MRTTKLRSLVAAMLLAGAPLALHAATPATTTTEIDKQTTQLNTTAENKGQTQVATKIASSFTKLAGSQDNALKLVQALRNGTAVTLSTSTTSTGGTGTGTATGTGTGTGTGGTTSTSFTPPTGKMGWGNVFISLALAQDQLARLGVTDPTQAQLQAALMGGDVTGADGKTVTLKGILQMRADGMGWGQIAQASGTKLGPVVSSIKSAHTKVAALPSTAGSGTTAPTSASGTTAKSTSKGVTTAAGTNANAGSKGLVTASGTSAGGSVTHGNSANAPGRGIVNAAGGGAANVNAATGSGNGQGAGVVNAGGGNAAGVSNAGGNGKGNAGGNGKGNGKGGG